MAMGWPEPINQMLSAIDRKERTLWAMPIVAALESRSLGTHLI